MHALPQTTRGASKPRVACDGESFLLLGLGGCARHAAGEATNVVLQRHVLFLELVVVGFHRLDALGECAEAGLQYPRVPVEWVGTVSVCVRDDGGGRQGYSCTAMRVSRLSLAVSSLLRRGLMARASSGGYASLRVSTLGLCSGTMLVLLGLRLLSLGRVGRCGWPVRSCSVSDDSVDEGVESGFEGVGIAPAVGCESGSAIEGRGAVSEEEDWDVVVVAM